MFWPTNKKSKKRGAAVRSAFKNTVAIDYLEDWKFRNHIAHMDERFEKWFAEFENRLIARQFVVFPSRMITLTGSTCLDV